MIDKFKRYLESGSSYYHTNIIYCCILLLLSIGLFSIGYIPLISLVIDYLDTELREIAGSIIYTAFTLTIICFTSIKIGANFKELKNS